MALWQGSSYLIPFLTFPYLTRTLGPAQYGLMGLALAIAAYGVLITDWGFNLTAANQISQARGDPIKLNDLFWSTLAAKGGLALFTLVVLAVAMVVSRELREMSVVILAAWLSVAASVFTGTWFLQGLERMGRFALAALFGKAITVPLTFWLVKASDDVAIAVAIQGIGGLLCALISLYLVATLRIISWPSVSRAAIRSQLRQGREVFLSTALISLYTNTSIVILGAVAGPVAVGLYAGSDKIRAAALGILAPLSTTAYPRLSWLLHHSPTQAYRFARKLLILQTALGLMIALAISFLAGPIVHLTMGSQFSDAVVVLRWLGWIPFVAAIHNVWGVQLMIPLGMDREFRASALIAALCNAVLIGPLSWWFGASGAAASVLVAVSCSTVAMGWFLWRRRAPVFPGFPVREGQLLSPAIETMRPPKGKS